MPAGGVFVWVGGWLAFMRALSLWRPCRSPSSRLSDHVKDATPQKIDAVNTRHGSTSHGQDALSNKDAESVSEQPSSVSPEMLAAIKLAIEDVVGTQLANIDKALTQLVQINERIEGIEHAMQATSNRLENVITTILPAITAHMSHLAEVLARRQLDLEVHRRKWNLVIHGIQGDAKEDGSVTRQTCMQFAKTILKVADAEATAFAACHRLSQKPNAGIILRFVDLAQRDSWISGTKHLKNYNSSPNGPSWNNECKDDLPKGPRLP